MADRNTPGSNRAIAVHGWVAIRSAPVMAVAAGVFGILQLILFEPAHASELWMPMYARMSGLLNIAGALGTGLFYLINRHLIQATDAAVRRYVFSFNITLIGSLFYCLGHIHLAGTHNSFVPLTLFIHLVVVSWFVPHRYVRYHYAVAAVAGLALVIAELFGALPYAPMLDRPDTLNPIFLDWRWVLGDVLMFTALTAPCMVIIGRLRRRFEQREAELERRVADKTRALRISHDHLEQQIDEVQSVNRALVEAERVRMAQAVSLSSLRTKLAQVEHKATLGEIAGSVAHQMMQPLAGILSNAQAAARLSAMPHVDTEEILAALDDIIDDERRAEAVIHAIRSLARETVLVRETVALGQVVSGTLELVSERAHASGVTIATDIDDMEVGVMGDSIQLSQVVLNLVSNSLDALAHATHAGEITVSVGREGDEARLVVADNGPGFAEHDLDRVFEPWVTFRPDGMGLGLALVRRIATAHEGSVTAGNRPAGGARVEVRLPAAP